MGKRKITYTAKPVRRIEIILTGKVLLQFRDEEEVAENNKGDLLVFPECEALHTTRQGQYDQIGFSGYFKVDVFDGKDWQPVILNDIFKRENHFSKTERPIDTYAICEEILEALKGRILLRTYREHYELE
jgi:hypothetical protein